MANPKQLTASEAEVFVRLGIRASRLAWPEKRAAWDTPRLDAITTDLAVVLGDINRVARNFRDGLMDPDEAEGHLDYEFMNLALNAFGYSEDLGFHIPGAIERAIEAQRHAKGRRDLVRVRRQQASEGQ